MIISIKMRQNLSVFDIERPENGSEIAINPMFLSMGPPEREAFSRAVQPSLQIFSHNVFW